MAQHFRVNVAGNFGSYASRSGALTDWFNSMPQLPTTKSHINSVRRRGLASDPPPTIMPPPPLPLRLSRKVKNSWGETWGQEGYILLERSDSEEDAGGECGLLIEATYPILEPVDSPSAAADEPEVLLALPEVKRPLGFTGSATANDCGGGNSDVVFDDSELVGREGGREREEGEKGAKIFFVFSGLGGQFQLVTEVVADVDLVRCQRGNSEAYFGGRLN